MRCLPGRRYGGVFFPLSQVFANRFGGNALQPRRLRRADAALCSRPFSMRERLSGVRCRLNIIPSAKHRDRVQPKAIVYLQIYAVKRLLMAGFLCTLGKYRIFFRQ
jgi:hypothetical protein